MGILGGSLGRPLSVFIGFVLVTAACGGAPAGQPVGTPSDGSPGATAATSSAPPASNATSASPTATSLPDGTLQVTIRNFSFQPAALEVTAGEPFTIEFHNVHDPGVFHDMDIRTKSGAKVVADQERIDGGQSAIYEYSGLEAGEYVFFSSVIPTIVGKLVVK